MPLGENHKINSPVIGLITAVAFVSFFRITWAAASPEGKILLLTQFQSFDTTVHSDTFSATFPNNAPILFNFPQAVWPSRLIAEIATFLCILLFLSVTHYVCVSINSPALERIYIESLAISGCLKYVTLCPFLTRRVRFEGEGFFLSYRETLICMRK